MARVLLGRSAEMGALPITVDPARRDSAPCEAPVMVDAGQFWCTGRCSEVSTKELTLTDVGSPLIVGAHVDVYFELAGLVAIEAKAVVTHAKGPRVTLRFLDLDGASVSALESYVSGGFHSSTHIRRRPLPAAE